MFNLFKKPSQPQVPGGPSKLSAFVQGLFSRKAKAESNETTFTSFGMASNESILPEDEKTKAASSTDLPLIGRLSTQTQYNLVIAVSVVLLTLSIGIAFVSDTLMRRTESIREKFADATQIVKNISINTEGAIKGNIEEFENAEENQTLLALEIAELAPYSKLSSARVLALPIVEHTKHWSDPVWRVVVGDSLDLTKRLELLLKSVDSFNKVLSIQPQYDSFRINVFTLRDQANSLSRLMGDAKSAGLNIQTDFNTEVNALRAAVNNFVISGGDLIEFSYINAIHLRALAAMPTDARGDAAPIAAKMQSILKTDMASLLAVISTDITHLMQTVTLDVSKISGENDVALQTARLPIETPAGILIAWASAVIIFFAGLLGISLLLVISQRASAKSAYLAHKEIKDTDAEVLSIMKQLRPISSGDLTSRIVVTEHVTGSIADRINDTTIAIQETLQLVKLATREAEGSIEDIYEQAEKSKDLTESASLQAIASREASEQGSTAVTMAVEHTQKQRVSMQEVAKRVKRLGEVAQSISRVTDLIEEVTGKTEVLAINTALKAADAGEEGAAFRVIAEEIRKLTNDTKRSLGDIFSAVQSMQGETQSVIQTVESVTAQVVDSAKFWDGAMSSLSSIRSSALDVDRLMTAVRDASLLQTRAAFQAVTVMEKLTSSTNNFRTEESEEAIAA